MEDLFPSPSISEFSSHRSWWEHTKAIITNAARRTHYWWDTVIGIAVALITLGLQAHWNLIPSEDWKTHKALWIASVCIAPLLVLAGEFILRLFQTPFKTYRNVADLYESELRELREFKRAVEDREVKLILVGCNHLKNVSHSTVHVMGADRQEVLIPSCIAESLTVTFENPRLQGMPGKIADDVLARVAYRMSDGTSFEQDGRWNQMEQPGSRSVSASTLDLLRITFNPGDRRDLDIAALFKEGLFAYNNDSQRSPGPMNPEKLLVGDVSVSVHLIATHVDQHFNFTIRRKEDGVEMEQCQTTEL